MREDEKLLLEQLFNSEGYAVLEKDIKRQIESFTKQLIVEKEYTEIIRLQAIINTLQRFLMKPSEDIQPAE